MTRQSQAMESFSRFVIAMAGALALAGAVAFAFAAMDDSGCSRGSPCNAQAEQQGHY